MSNAFEHAFFYKCPECHKDGFAALLQGQEGYRIPKGFEFSTRDGYVTVVCKCGAKVIPKGMSD